MTDEPIATTTVEPSATAEAIVVRSGDEPLVTIYEADTGNPLTIRRSLAAKMLRSHEFTTEPFDLDECLADWRAKHLAVESAVLCSVSEITARRCIPNISSEVMNAAQHEAVAAYAKLVRALEAKFRPEAEIAALAAHLLENGSLDAMHNVPTLHEAAAAYLETRPQEARKMARQAERESAASTPRETK